MAVGKHGDFSAKLVLVCAECGKTFRAYRSQRNDLEMAFCTHACHHASWRKLVKRLKALRAKGYSIEDLDSLVD